MEDKIKYKLILKPSHHMLSKSFLYTQVTQILGKSKDESQVIIKSLEEGKEIEVSIEYNYRSIDDLLEKLNVLGIFKSIKEKNKVGRTEKEITKEVESILNEGIANFILVETNNGRPIIYTLYPLRVMLIEEEEVYTKVIEKLLFHNVEILSIDDFKNKYVDNR